MADDLPPQLPTPLYLARLLMRLDLLYPPYAVPTNPEEQTEAADFLPLYEAVFTETKNPLYVLAAYRHARSWRLDVPEWVLGYLDSAVEKLWVMVRQSDPSNDSKPDVAEALGMKRLGRSTVFSEFRGDSYATDIELVERVALRLLAGDKLYLAWEIVAKEFGVNPEKVRHACDKYKHLFKHRFEPDNPPPESPSHAK